VIDGMNQGIDGTVIVSLVINHWLNSIIILEVNTKPGRTVVRSLGRSVGGGIDELIEL